VSIQAIIFQNDDERRLWTSVFESVSKDQPLMSAVRNADAAVRELRARMPAAQVQPTYPPPGEEPRVVQCEDGQWLVVRGNDGLEWWNPDMQMWRLHTDLGTGIYFTQAEAVSDLASLSPAQLAAQVGVEVKA